MLNTIQQWRDAGFRFFGLHPFRGQKCGCGNKDCKAAGKHPIVSNWTNTPIWSDEQFEIMQMMGELDTGWGALLDGLLVVDIDTRNGGERIPDWEEQCGYVVATGGGGWHYYFLNSEPVSKKVDGFQGVDFLSGSSFSVVGAGSKHKSGGEYKIIKGSPSTITQVPEGILSRIKRENTVRVRGEKAEFDIEITVLEDCLFGIKNDDVDYEKWLAVGMALHHSTKGSAVGMDMWKRWSAQSSKSTGKSIGYKWDSFGKQSNPVTYATLYHYATQDGWIEPVTFPEPDDDDVPRPTTAPNNGIPFTIDDIDLQSPPEFVGELTNWIDSQCLYPRRKLAVATALQCIGDIGGLNYILDDGMTTSNLIVFCIAGSSTGKEAVLQARFDILKTAGVIAAHHGGIKSEQELIRNMLRHDASLYTIDEIGIMLTKVENSKKRGGASYLEGVIGIIMSAYSKANGTFGVSGDLRDTAKATIRSEMKQVTGLAKEGEITPQEEQDRVAELEQALQRLESGIEKPFVSIMGYTTPSTFESVVSFDNLTNGFIARSVMVDEADTNPKHRKGFRKPAMPMVIENTLMRIQSNGNYSMERHSKISRPDNQTVIPSTDEAIELMDKIMDYQWQLAEQAKADNGYEAVCRRTAEMVNKISLILAIPSKLRTEYHVRWAFAYVKNDIERKINLANSIHGDAEEGVRASSTLEAKILTVVDKDTWEGEGTIINRCRKWKKRDVQVMLAEMTTAGTLKLEEKEHKYNKTTTRMYQMG